MVPLPCVAHDWMRSYVCGSRPLTEWLLVVALHGSLSMRGALDVVDAWSSLPPSLTPRLGCRGVLPPLPTCWCFRSVPFVFFFFGRGERSCQPALVGCCQWHAFALPTCWLPRLFFWECVYRVRGEAAAGMEQGLLLWYALPSLCYALFVSPVGAPFSSLFPFDVTSHLLPRLGWQIDSSYGARPFLPGGRAVVSPFLWGHACTLVRVCLSCCILSIFYCKESRRGCDNSSFFSPTHLCVLLLPPTVLIMRCGERGGVHSLAFSCLILGGGSDPVGIGRHDNLVRQWAAAPQRGGQERGD